MLATIFFVTSNRLLKTYMFIRLSFLLATDMIAYLHGLYKSNSMAFQRGIIKLKGSIGDITFYKSQDGYLAREKGGIEKERIMSDPAFQRTRENFAEFGRAGSAAKLFRDAFRILINRSKDARVSSRLTRTFLRGIQQDSVNERGLRTIDHGSVIELQNFDFNIRARFNSTFFSPYTYEIDRATGIVQIDIPSFVPTDYLATPIGSTHFRLGAAAGGIDFAEETFETNSSFSDHLPLATQATSDINLSIALKAELPVPIFVLLSIEYLQEVNGNYYTLRNGLFNALAIVAVDTAIGVQVEGEGVTDGVNEPGDGAEAG